MKLILLTTLLSSTLSFAPSPRTSTTTTTSLSALSVPKLSVPKLSNPYKSLPWIVEREQHRTEREHEIANAAMFRELGLPFDAKYEDVKEKTDELIEHYKATNDIKSRIKVEVARDKIFMLKLNERMEGLESGEDVMEQQGGSEDGGMEVQKSPFRFPVISNLIDYGYTIYMPPDEAWTKRQYVIWGLSTLFCLVNPPMVENFSRVNWLAAGGMMGYRGMPGMENKEPGYNPFRGKRNKAHQVQAMGVGLAIWVVAKMLAESFVMRVPALVASRSCEWFKFAIVQGILCLSCLYVQTYQGEGGKDLMI